MFNNLDDNNTYTHIQRDRNVIIYWDNDTL